MNIAKSILYSCALTPNNHDLISERKKCGNLTTVQTRLFKDISELSNILQDNKALKEKVSNICRKYVKFLDMKGGMTEIEDETETKQAFEEIMRQKAFLER